MQCIIPYKNLDKALFFFEKPDILSEKLKNLMTSKYHLNELFFAENFWTFPTYLSLQKAFYTLTETRFFTFVSIIEELNKVNFFDIVK